MKVAEKKILNAAFAEVEQMIDSLTRIKDDWEESIDGKSDKWRESEKGERQQERIDALTNVLDSLETIKDDLQTATQEDE
jgi:hypothetical protein